MANRKGKETVSWEQQMSESGYAELCSKERDKMAATVKLCLPRALDWITSNNKQTKTNTPHPSGEESPLHKYKNNINNAPTGKSS